MTERRPLPEPGLSDPDSEQAEHHDAGKEVRNEPRVPPDEKVVDVDRQQLERVRGRASPPVSASFVVMLPPADANVVPASSNGKRETNDRRSFGRLCALVVVFTPDVSHVSANKLRHAAAEDRRESSRPS
jgi:hypothetical protein